jgi:CRISPR-associated endonuclease/helicase Cas3
MSKARFDDFFKTATAVETGPFDYQRRLACGDCGKDESDEEWLSRGTGCESKLIDIPTGLGKTAAVVLAWLWNRFATPHSAWPRRLVYCLPMRTLVEQTRENVKTWLENLAKKYPNEAVKWLVKNSPVILMGGEEADANQAQWDNYPERPAILIGTQDMLLSRALNRGYGMSRYRWPMHFGLLNNDALWVMDETQLMGPGLATACQLEAFRRNAGGKKQGFGSWFGSRSVTWYASATANSESLVTREWRDGERGLWCPVDFRVSLSETEETDSVIACRRCATKRLEIRPQWHFDQQQPSEGIVNEVITRHRAMVHQLHQHNAPPEVPLRTLIICNTVDRAMRTFERLRSRQDEGELCGVDLVLMHSRFRPRDRERQVERLEAGRLTEHSAGQIVVATQVIEAGLDLSSGILWSEVAPLASLVQRLGRLNRAGEFGSGGDADFGWKPVCFILGIQLPEVQKRTGETNADLDLMRRRTGHLPYDFAKSESALSDLMQLDGDASAAALEALRDKIAASIERSPYSLQKHELLDFFDTDSNLSLGYTDVSPFVRGLDQDTDVYVLWREWSGSPRDHFGGHVGRDELCPVPISKLTGKGGFAGWRKGWLWTGRKRGWRPAATEGIQPGATLLLSTSAGGYDPQRGWTGDPNDQPDDLFVPPELPSEEEMLSALSHGWQSIEEHTADVLAVLEGIVACLPQDAFEAEKQALLEAVTWHDAGKNHWRWRWAAARALLKARVPKERIKPHLPLAKFSLADSPRLRDQQSGQLLPWDAFRRELYQLKHSFRPGLDHEVASGLALRQWHIETAGHLRSPEEETRATYILQLLAEYLVMSHHGTVRKVLRDEIPRNPRTPKEAEMVCGVRQDDPLPPVKINGATPGCAALSVDCRRMGRGHDGYESYTRGVLRLLEHYGPFRLGYLEAIFRAADCRASAEATRQADKVEYRAGFESPGLVREEPGDQSPALSTKEKALVDELVADGLDIQDRFQPEPLYKQTGKGSYKGATVDEIQKARRQERGRDDKQ